METATNRDIEFSSREDMAATQEHLLRRHLAHCRAHSRFYQEAWKDLDVRAEAFRLADLPALPLTGKCDLEGREDAFLAVSPSEVADIVLSSGTTGLPTRIAYTARDLERLAYNEEKSFAGCGVSARDVVLLTCTMDRCFVAGLAYFLGVRRLGAAAIRNGHGTMEGHRFVIQQMRPTVVVGVPSFLRKLGQYVRQADGPGTVAPVQRLVCIGEPLRTAALEPTPLAAELEALWEASCFSTYASTETISTFCECESRCGGHLHPDLAVLEIVDGEGRRCEPGTLGEVVITPLQVEGMPLVRFRTGDMAFRIEEPCACGRCSPRLGPILGRRQQMLKVHGTTLYPPAIYSVLDDMPEVADYYVEAARTEEDLDRVEVHVAAADPDLSAGAVRDRLQARLRVAPEVTMESRGDVAMRVYDRESRKPVRFFDRRNESR